MKTQTIQFATVIKNGVVQKVGKSTILQPKTNFKGGSIKWYEDKKKADKQHNEASGQAVGFNSNLPIGSNANYAKQERR